MADMTEATALDIPYAHSVFFWCVVLSGLVLAFFATYTRIAPPRPLSMRPVSIVRGDTCYANMLGNFLAMGMLDGRAVQMYTRQSGSWLAWGECKTGTLVEVSEGMIAGAKADAALRAEKDLEYQIMRRRAESLLEHKE